jgi:hypothetical protein
MAQRPLTARRRARHDGGAGERCGMCGAVVAVDAQGRCPLGHRVREPDPAVSAPAAAPASAPGTDDGRVVAVYAEPAQPAAGPWSSGRPADVAPPPAADPTPLLGAWAVARDAPPLPVRIPDRLREPLGPPPALVVRSEELDDSLVREHASNAAAFAAMVAFEPQLHGGDVAAPPPAPAAPSAPAPAPSALGEPPVPDRAPPGPDDLAGHAPSVLDAVPEPAPAPAVPAPAAAGDAEWHDTADEDDGGDVDPADVIPPRGWGAWLAAALFLGALLFAAWSLATSLS